MITTAVQDTAAHQQVVRRKPGRPPGSKNKRTSEGSSGQPRKKQKQTVTTPNRSSARSVRGTSSSHSKSLYYEGSSEEDETDQLIAATVPRPYNAPKNTSSAALNGPKARARSQEAMSQYIHTFTTVLDYPKNENAVALAEAMSANDQSKSRTRQSKVDAKGRIEGTSTTQTRPSETTDAVSATTINGEGSGKGISLLPPISANNGTPSARSTPFEVTPLNNPLFKKAQIVPVPKLVNKSVSWSGPRHPPARTKPRLFGLPECPTFYPTAEEFQDPMAYMKKIGDEGQGRQFGMAKVVPPSGWRMPFAIDTEVSQIRWTD